MPLDLESCSQAVRRLRRAVRDLRPVAESVGVAAPEGQEWFELLEHKLAAQLSADSPLVVAVVGGTNIGKSVLFNHLAGEMASAVSPLAAGTKHPVCLAPEPLADERTLARYFEGFELRPWSSAEDPLSTTEEHLLFWRQSDGVPERLLLLDTPDIDSDAQVNWLRADHIRQSADVLVACLTQQKYNDAAVKRFFRRAAEADKPVVVVFNQCDLEHDREFWPQWLATFVSETRVEAMLVYVVPRDRAAANELRLPFYEVGRDGRDELGEETSLRDELASLRFEEIKLRTLRGAAKEIADPDRGAPRWLEQIRRAAAEFAEAAAVLSSTRLARVSWPTLPPGVLVEEIRDWWDERRSGWTRGIHGFYRNVGRGLAWPVRKTRQAISGETPDPLEGFQRREREAIVRAVGGLFEELGRLSAVGNRTLQPRLARLLAGQSRAELLQKVEASHAELPPVSDDYRQFLRRELAAWTRANPRATRWLRWGDHVAAFARPAITVGLFATGLSVAADVVASVAVDAAITGGVAVGGEAAVTGAGEGVKHAAAQLFGRLQAEYARGRAAWLGRWLEGELLGDLLVDLKQGAEAPDSDAFQDAQTALEDLRRLAEGEGALATTSTAGDGPTNHTN